MERARNLRYNLTLSCVCACMIGYIGREYSAEANSYFYGVISTYFVLIPILLYFVFSIGSLVPRKSKLMMFWDISAAILMVKDLRWGNQKNMITPFIFLDYVL